MDLLSDFKLDTTANAGLSGKPINGISGDSRPFHDFGINLDPVIYGYILDTRGGDRKYTNVPHYAVQGSPSGYAWGYMGSGPTDLAMNMTHDLLLRIGYSGPLLKVFKGQIFAAAFKLRTHVRDSTVAAVSQDGGEVLHFGAVLKLVTKLMSMYNYWDPLEVTQGMYMDLVDPDRWVGFAADRVEARVGAQKRLGTILGEMGDHTLVYGELLAEMLDIPSGSHY